MVHSRYISFIMIAFALIAQSPHINAEEEKDDKLTTAMKWILASSVVSLVSGVAYPGYYGMNTPEHAAKNTFDKIRHAQKLEAEGKLEQLREEIASASEKRYIPKPGTEAWDKHVEKLKETAKDPAKAATGLTQEGVEQGSRPGLFERVRNIFPRTAGEKSAAEVAEHGAAGVGTRLVRGGLFLGSLGALAVGASMLAPSAISKPEPPKQVLGSEGAPNDRKLRTAELGWAQLKQE